MIAHQIPADADLVSLVLLNKEWEIEDALQRRRANRERNRQRSLKSARTRRIREMEGVRK